MSDRDRRPPARRALRAGAAAAFVMALAIATTVRLGAPVPALDAEWTEPRTGMAFVLVRAGTFEMGTPPDEPAREAGEVPHVVRLTRPFYFGRYEVTQGQWEEVMRTQPSHFTDCGRRCPVESVTWFDAQAFASRLSARTGERFRLPTEAEWEYVCRAGRAEPFGHLSSLSSREANINGNYPYNAAQGTFRERPTAVGYFPPNPWGVHDMSGNVWEWVQDWHCPYPSGLVADPVGECATGRRVIRGGSWLFDGASARCGLRYTHRPEDKGFSLGFRLVREVTGPSR